MFVVFGATLLSFCGAAQSDCNFYPRKSGAAWNKHQPANNAAHVRATPELPGTFRNSPTVIRFVFSTKDSYH